MPDGAGTPPPQDERSVSELVFDVAEKSSSLLREEIELAKAEVAEKSARSSAAPLSASPPAPSPSWR